MHFDFIIPKGLKITSNYGKRVEKKKKLDIPFNLLCLLYIVSGENTVLLISDKFIFSNKQIAVNVSCFRPCIDCICNHCCGCTGLSHDPKTNLSML